MTRTQFWLLSAVSAVLIVVLFGHVYALRVNNKLVNQLNSERAYIANAQRLQPALQNLVRRIDAAGQNDIQLKSLLTKYDIKVNRDAATADGAQKPK
jgi:hypothetical protein